VKLAVLGGSFNPLHLGHLILAETALAAFDYERIILIPAFKSPFKPGAPGMETSAGDRLDMLAASVAGDPRFTMDDCEIRREGLSYTIDTVNDIERRYCPDGKIGLIVGDDLARDFRKWKRFDELIEKVDVIIARRMLDREQKLPYPNKQLRNEITGISSAMVRERIAAGKGWRYLVPAGARTIIEDRRLYGYAGDGPAAGGTDAAITKDLLVRVENAARAELARNRFLHSRNTALFTWDLCRRFALDPAAGYLAGIAHDFGKQLSEDRLTALAESDGGHISKLERKKPSLLHGRAAAVLLRERFDIHNKDILEAVAFHTEGLEGMGLLAKAVYIADKIEVSREGVDPALRELAAGAGDLDLIFGAVLRNTVAFLQARKLDLSEGTLRLLEAVQKRNKH
jgi:nicotinate-nucleotide adenylyltransferase